MVFVYDKVGSRSTCIAVDAGLKYQKQSGDAVFVWWAEVGLLQKEPAI